MPSLYAHYTFGQKVRKLLPEEIQVCIDLYEDQFNLGLQGPDFLFFYRPLKMNSIRYLGHRIHKKPAAFYLKKLIPVVEEEGPYSPESAYLLGFLCHFMLDSKVHPYVNQKILETGLRHGDMEGEFEKYLMYLDRVDPDKYPIWKHVPVSGSIFRTIHKMYPWINAYYGAASVCYFRFSKWLVTAQCPVKKALILWGIKKSGYYEKLKGHYICDGMNGDAVSISEGFVKLYKEEILKTAAMEEKLWHILRSDKKEKLPARFAMNFDGVKMKGKSEEER